MRPAEPVTSVISRGPLGGFAPREVLVLAALMLPSALTLIDMGMLSVALPNIQSEFGLTVDLLSWAVAASFLPMVALMPIFGRLGDLMGKRRLYLIGYTIFSLGATIGIFAPSYGWLIAARLLQGAGMASMPLAMALIVDAFGHDRRGRALGIWNGAAPTGIILGPVLGGLVVESLGWHANFAFIAAASFLSLLLVVRLIPSPQKRDGDGSFDWNGAVALVVVAAGAILALTTHSVIPLGSLLNLLFWGVTALALLALYWNARRRPDPFVDGDIVRNKRFLLPSIAVNMRMFAHDGSRFLMVLYLANVFGKTPRGIGLFILSYSVPLLIGIVSGGFFTDRWSTRAVGAASMFLQAIGTLWLGLVGPAGGALLLAPGMILSGLSGGTSLIPFTKIAIESLGPDRAGLASGLYNTVRFAGSAAAPPLLGLFLATSFARHGGLETVSEPYQLGFQIVALAAALGAGVALLIPKEPT